MKSISHNLCVFSAIFITISNNLIIKCASKNEYETTKCRNESFRCASGLCISNYLVCDGIKHCQDGSDESESTCSKINCPGYMFRCNYGACIKLSSICNGIIDCIDASDEPPISSCRIPSYVPIKTTTRKTTTPKSTTKMYTPYNPRPSSTTESTTQSITKLPIIPTESIPQGSCQLPEKSEDHSYKINDCDNGSKATICDSKSGQYVDQVTLLTLECNPNYYSRIDDITTTFCLDGKWTPPIVNCEECGLPNSPTASSNDNYIPWLVSVYDSLKSYSVCWGTLVSPHTIVTAAHCVFDESTGTKKDPSNFYILIGKHLTGGIEDDETQQFKISNINLTDDSFKGITNNYQGNIAILEIDSKIIFSEVIKPVCVDWKNKLKFEPNEGTQGLIAAWIINKKKAMGEIHPQQYPFISNQHCKSLASKTTKPLLTNDKFCVALDPGTTIDNGNGGNGFFLKSNGRNNAHLFGVISTHFYDSSNTPVLIVTDIRKYRDKIKLTVDEIENRRKTDEFIDVRFPTGNQPPTKML